MKRKLLGRFNETPEMINCGLTIDILKRAIEHTHIIIDEIDKKLLSLGADRLSQTVELANLSSMIGNILGAGVVSNSNNIYKRNKPHKYPDVLSNHPTSSDIEIKIALETNNPKGHLAKEGYYLICRYVLIDENFKFNKDTRGNIAEIWEARFGFLKTEHFNISNTSGDSGKTAVVNKNGMEQLKVIYANTNICPYSQNSATFKKLYSKFL
ncbi:MAG: hypothetical protein SNH13_02115 [Rikenellaceae bacterium]